MQRPRRPKHSFPMRWAGALGGGAFAEGATTTDDGLMRNTAWGEVSFMGVRRRLSKNRACSSPLSAEKVGCTQVCTVDAGGVDLLCDRSAVSRRYKRRTVKNATGGAQIKLGSISPA